MEYDRLFGIADGPELTPLVEGVDYIPGNVQVMTTPCNYKGVDFPSMTAAAEHFGVTISAVSMYVNRDGCHRYDYPVVYKGKTYKSIADAANLNGAKYGSVARWVHRHQSYAQ